MRKHGGQHLTHDRSKRTDQSIIGLFVSGGLKETDTAWHWVFRQDMSACEQILDDIQHKSVESLHDTWFTFKATTS